MTCPECSKPLTGHVEVTGAGEDPVPGDVTVCIGCATPLVFVGLGKLYNVDHGTCVVIEGAYLYLGVRRVELDELEPELQAVVRMVRSQVERSRGGA